jgi:hypothetical protein
VEIMRSGLLGYGAALAGAALLTAACSQAAGVAGVSVRTPSTPPATAGPSVTATIPDPAPVAETLTAVQPPDGGKPVKVPPPKLSKFTYTFPVKGCAITYERRQLVPPKTTIWTGRGCAFVAPVSGVIDEVNTTNRWSPATDAGADREGRFVTLVGDDGVRYLGGHLDSVADGLRPGARVAAGQYLGGVGNSGNAGAGSPNLYFAISWKTAQPAWWVRRGMVDPSTYLAAWQAGNRTLSPSKEAMALRARVGETPPCVTLCTGRKKDPVVKPRTKKTADPQVTLKPIDPS